MKITKKKYPRPETTCQKKLDAWYKEFWRFFKMMVAAMKDKTSEEREQMFLIIEQ